jgi:hypothetical protein
MQTTEERAAYLLAHGWTDQTDYELEEPGVLYFHKPVRGQGGYEVACEQAKEAGAPRCNHSAVANRNGVAYTTAMCQLTVPVEEWQAMAAKSTQRRND